VEARGSNAKTGAKLWSFTTGIQASSSSAVANGMAYVGSRQGMTGHKDQHRRQALGHNAGLVYSSPAVANGMIYVGSRSGKVNAFGLEVMNGREPTVANGVVYVGSAEGNVYALNAKTGAKLWSYPTDYGAYSSRAVADGVVYVGSENGKVYAFGLKCTNRRQTRKGS
jgi:eukaryotic-like serine/threonine-protein kinase